MLNSIILPYLTKVFENYEEVVDENPRPMSPRERMLERRARSKR